MLFDALLGLMPAKVAVVLAVIMIMALIAITLSVA